MFAHREILIFLENMLLLLSEKGNEICFRGKNDWFVVDEVETAVKSPIVGDGRMVDGVLEEEGVGRVDYVGERFGKGLGVGLEQDKGMVRLKRGDVHWEVAIYYCDKDNV